MHYFDIIAKLPMRLLLNFCSKQVRFVNYHNVYNENDTEIKRGISSKTLKSQIEWLQSFGFRFISLKDALRDYNKNKSLKKTIVFTTDDALIDNINAIAPVFDEYGIKPTIFINSDKVGNKGVMTVEQINHLISKGYEIGSHTCNHTSCINMTADDVKNEIANDISNLQRIFHRNIRYFAFPFGHVFKKYSLIDNLKSLGLEVVLSVRYYCNNYQYPLCWGRDKGEMPLRKFQFNFLFRPLLLLILNRIKPFDKRYLLFN